MGATYVCNMPFVRGIRLRMVHMTVITNALNPDTIHTIPATSGIAATSLIPEYAPTPSSTHTPNTA